MKNLLCLSALIGCALLASVGFAAEPAPNLVFAYAYQNGPNAERPLQDLAILLNDLRQLKVSYEIVGEEYLGDKTVLHIALHAANDYTERRTGKIVTGVVSARLRAVLDTFLIEPYGECFRSNTCSDYQLNTADL